MKLVESHEGVGKLRYRGRPVGEVAYSINRFQAMTAGGLPVPGLHRIEGKLALDALAPRPDIAANARVALDLEDGRRLELVLLDQDGSVLAEGHGPGQCGCC